jgi:hypothetical protein
MTLRDNIAGYLLSELKAIRSNLTGRDCFNERVADSLRRATEAIKRAEDVGVVTMHPGDYLYGELD